MESKELRIGNWIYSNLSEEEFEVESQYFEMIEDGFGGYSPIPLTEEWLVNFGFEGWDKGELTVILNNGNVFYKNHSIECLPIANIKYVHQLQNLYFALTGEELAIN